MGNHDQHNGDSLENLDSIPLERFLALQMAILECPATVGELESKMEALQLGRERSSWRHERVDASVVGHPNDAAATERRSAKLRHGVLENMVDGLSDELTPSGAFFQLQAARAKTAERLEAHQKIIEQFEAATRSLESVR